VVRLTTQVAKNVTDDSDDVQEILTMKSIINSSLNFKNEITSSA
jgi:hypothetical protein